MIHLKDGTRLVGVRAKRSGFPEHVYDDGEGGIYVFGYEYGPSMFIRAPSFETAWEIAIDESTPIDQSEVPEAYGFENQEALDAAVACAKDGDYPELVEGYELQSNSTGTGIVDVGHYAWLEELDERRHLRADWLDRGSGGYRLLVQRDDIDCEPVELVLRSVSYTLTVRGITKTFRSYDLIDDVGARLRKLERALGACDVTVSWARD